jgi:integrase
LRFYKYLLSEKMLFASANDIERMRGAFHDVRRVRRPLPKLPPEESVYALLDVARRVKPEPNKPRLELARLRNKVLPLTTYTVRLVFNVCARDANIEIAMTPHSLRHAFATKVLEATGDLAVVQDMLGHSSPAATRIYAKVSSKRMREAHRSAFNYRGKDEEDK